ncbi:hypothetical protein Prudu_019036 [Prunus dulcis]|uniref:Uncharacterized protein n=1 Tax=Prunus dulcis TaxID=3755 RepID=A0A4Y1RS27_PRUDU|nr:hypothetical protein Prudu_019036 [Prunus dulcis]
MLIRHSGLSNSAHSSTRCQISYPSNLHNSESECETGLLLIRSITAAPGTLLYEKRDSQMSQLSLNNTGSCHNHLSFCRRLMLTDPQMLGLVVYRCIPFKYTNLVENSDGTHEKVVEVLMINSTSGPGLVFPKLL